MASRASLEADILPPIAHPLLVSEHGEAWFAHPFAAGAFRLVPICTGIGLCWAETPELGGVVLHLIGGNAADPTDECVAAALSRNGLRALIRDLQSIDDQLEQADG